MKAKLSRKDDAVRRPVIFISYSHDSPRHRERVGSLAKRLEKDAGCDCRIDTKAEPKVLSWPRWMRRQIQEADYVLMIFSATYRRRFDGYETEGVGKGATWEGSLIENHLYAGAAAPELLKFVPVILDASAFKHVPPDIFSGTIFHAAKDWNRLLKRIKLKHGSAADASDAPPAEQRRAAPPPPASAGISGKKGNMNSMRVLFLGAEKGTGLDLRSQLSQTRKAVTSAKYCQSVIFKGVFNITPDQMVMELNGQCPDVLHLSGKQEAGCVKMHDAAGRLTPVSADYLAEILSGYGHTLRLVILDTCYSWPQASMLCERIDAAIGVEGPIVDPVAITFFAMFYNALANGASLADAFNLARQLELAKIMGNVRYRKEIEWILDEPFNADRHLPRLATRKGIKADRFVVAPSAAC